MTDNRRTHASAAALRAAAFAAILGAILLHPLAASAQSLAISSASAQCGKSVKVNVTIGSTSGLLAAQFKVTYDATKLTATQVTTGALTSGFSIASNLATPGVVTVALASGSAVNGSGTLASITFSAAAAATGNVSLGISEILVNDVPKSGSGGTIEISCLQPPASAPVLTMPPNGSLAPRPVTLQWNAVTGATKYRVYLGTGTPKFYDETTKTVVANVVASPGVNYSWYVRAENAAGLGPASATFTFTPEGTACDIPAAPAITLPATAVSDVSYEVSWPEIGHATDYVLEEADNQAFTGAVTLTTIAASVTRSKSVTVPTTFFYRVKARNREGECSEDGPLSPAKGIVVSPKPSVPPIPAGAAVLPAVGSSPGAFGAMFRTSVQLHNHLTSRIRGRIVFHAAGAQGTEADPSLAYDLAPGETVSFSDLLPAIGIEKGLGSADVVPDPLGTALPLLVTRIYNDGGAAGTAGMTMDTARLDDALTAGTSGIVVAPMNPASMRMNVGIRTLGEGATFTVVLRDRSGAVVTSRQVSYPPTYFLQPSAQDLLGAAVTADATLNFSMEAGAAIIYASTTDNTTQDTQVQIARPIQ